MSLNKKNKMLRVACGMSLLLSHFAATVTASADTTVLSLPFYGYDGQSIDASVVGVSHQTTTLSLSCADGAGADDCGLFPVQVLTIAPDFYLMNLGVNDASDFTGTQSCNRHGVTEAVCAESNAGSAANFPGSSTETYTGSSITVLPVTVTAGAKDLGAGSASSSATSSSSGAASTGATGSMATASATTSSSGSSGVLPAPTGSSSSTGTAPASTKTTTSKNSAPRMQSGSGSAGMAAALAVLAGAAAL